MLSIQRLTQCTYRPPWRGIVNRFNKDVQGKEKAIPAISICTEYFFLLSAKKRDRSAEMGYDIILGKRTDSTNIET